MTTSTGATTQTVLRAEGFACPSCVTKIEKRVGGMKGVKKVDVKFASSRINVDHDPAVVSVEDLIAAIDKAGYKATPSAF